MPWGWSFFSPRWAPGHSSSGLALSSGLLRTKHRAVSPEGTPGLAQSACPSYQECPSSGLRANKCLPDYFRPSQRAHEFFPVSSGTPPSRTLPAALHFRHQAGALSFSSPPSSASASLGNTLGDIPRSLAQLSAYVNLNSIAICSKSRFLTSTKRDVISHGSRGPGFISCPCHSLSTPCWPPVFSPKSGVMTALTTRACRELYV